MDRNAEYLGMSGMDCGKDYGGRQKGQMKGVVTGTNDSRHHGRNGAKVVVMEAKGSITCRGGDVGTSGFPLGISLS